MKRKFLWTPALLLASALWINPAQAQQTNETRQSESRTSLSVNSWGDSDESQISYTEDGHKYRIRMKGSQVTEMYVDDKKVAEEDFSKYDALIKKIRAQIEKDREQARLDRAQAERDREQADRDRAQAEKDRQQADRDREQARKDREQADRDRQNGEAGRQQAERDRQQADKDRQQAERDRAQAERDREQAAKDRAQAEIDRKQAEEDRKLMDALIDELVTEKLIESRDALTSLDLDNTTLVVNGKEQPASLHSRLKAKYLKGDRSAIHYHNSGSNRNLSYD